MGLDIENNKSVKQIFNIETLEINNQIIIKCPVDRGYDVFWGKIYSVDNYPEGQVSLLKSKDDLFRNPLFFCSYTYLFIYLSKDTIMSGGEDQFMFDFWCVLYFILSNREVWK